MKAFQWSAASLLSILCTFSVSVQAAPGGVSFSDAGLWLKSDDAGDIAVAWKDNSGASNNVEVRVTGSAAPWALSAADAEHNFHPYTSGYQNNRLFHDTDASFVDEGDNVTPLTMIAVTRLTDLPDTDSVARIMGLANSTLPEAAEPGLSVAGADSDYAGRLQLSFESEFSSWPDYLYSSPVPLSASVINFAVVGGSNNTDVTLGYNNTQAFSVADEPVVTRGDTVSIGYGTRFAESAQPFNGDIMEVIWYADELSENELQRVHSYLADVALAAAFNASSAASTEDNSDCGEVLKSFLCVIMECFDFDDMSQIAEARKRLRHLTKEDTGSVDHNDDDSVDERSSGDSIGISSVWQDVDEYSHVSIITDDGSNNEQD